MSIPLRNTQKPVLNVGQPVIQRWVAGLKRKRWRRMIWVWKEASWHSQTSQHHKSSWIHASYCVCEAPCAMRGAEYYINLMIFEFNKDLCQEGAMVWLLGWFVRINCFSLHRNWIVLITHVKGHLCTLTCRFRSVFMVCMRRPHANTPRVCC